MPFIRERETSTSNELRPRSWRRGAWLLACALAGCGPQSADHERFVPSADAGRGLVLEPSADAAASPLNDALAAIPGRSYALVIGIDRYESMPRLFAAAADAQAVAQQLRAAQYEVTLLLNKEATRGAIMEQLSKRLPSVLQPDDRLLVFFAGHGASLGGKLGYWMPVEADVEALSAQGLSMLELQQFFRLMKSRHVMLVADACYSGHAIQFDDHDLPASDPLATGPRWLLGQPVRVVLVAGASDQEAMEIDGHGVFTRFFLDAIAGAADQDGNALVTSAEIVPFVQSRVHDEVERRFQRTQWPQTNRHGEGEFVFLKRGGSSVLSTPSACRDGKITSVDTQGHCCWYGQAWSTPKKACVGDPDCPPGTVARGESCVVAQAIASLADAGIGDPSGLQLPAGSPEIAQRYQKGCAQGNARDCTDLGVLFQQGEGVAPNLPRALALHTRACDEHSGVGCRRLAELQIPKGVSAPPAAQKRRWQDFSGRACDNGDLVSCQRLAAVLLTEKKTAENKVRGAELLAQACDKQHGASCELLGNLYETGDGVAADPARALTLYQAACKGSTARCASLSRVFATGKLVPQDAVQAAKLARKACEGGEALGCALWAEALRSGRGVAPDPAAADAAAARACAGGVEAECPPQPKAQSGSARPVVPVKPAIQTLKFRPELVLAAQLNAVSAAPSLKAVPLERALATARDAGASSTLTRDAAAAPAILRDVRVAPTTARQVEAVSPQQLKATRTQEPVRAVSPSTTAVLKKALLDAGAKP